MYTCSGIPVHGVSGIGFGMGIPAIAVAVQAPALQENFPIAISLSTFSRSFGQALGVVDGGATFVFNFLDETDDTTRFQIRLAYIESLRKYGRLERGLRDYLYCCMSACEET